MAEQVLDHPDILAALQQDANKLINDLIDQLSAGRTTS